MPVTTPITTTSAVTVHVHRDLLAGALGAVARTVERRNTIPILSNILLRVEAGKLHLVATDLDIEASTVITLDDPMLPDMATTMPAQMLTDIVRRLPGGADVGLCWGDGGDATITCGRSRYRINVLPAAEWPAFSRPDDPVSFRVDARVFRRLFERTEFAISDDEVRYFLNGVFLHVKPGEAPRLIAVSTDGHRLSRIETAAPAGADGMPPVIVPRKTVREIIRMLDGKDGEADVSVSREKIAVRHGASALLSKLIDGTFPDYERVIPSTHSRAVRVVSSALAGAADRVSVVSGERGKAVKLSMSGSTCRMDVVNPDAGAASEEVDIELDGDQIDIAYNARYLADALKALDADTISIRLGDPGSPGSFTSAAGGDHLIILMPVRLDHVHQ